MPWWGYAAAFIAALVLAWLAYARAAVPLSPRQRYALTTLRALTLLLIVVILLRPVRAVPAEGARESLVAILVDGSRSMRLPEGGEGSGSRIDRARATAATLASEIGGDYRTEILSFGETLARTTPDQLAATARRSDLSGALEQLAERFRGRDLAGVVVLSDGGDTAATEAGGSRALGVPVFAIGIGAGDGLADREIVNLTAGDPALTGSSVDLSVSVASRGFGTAPIVLRLTENGRPLETRRVTPPAEGVVLHEVFTVSPAADRPSVYSVDIPVESGEVVSENNTRQVLVPAQGRRRRLLIVEGAPGFEHTFLKRALARDPALEIDSVVRKGQNEGGRDTFFIQAAASRAASLGMGYPTTRAELFVYDGVVLGNVAGDFFSREQLQATADFVSIRGGGLIVLGARSFEGGGLVGTPLEPVLPLDVTDRSRVVVAADGGLTAGVNAAAVTADGVAHPATRLGPTAQESRQRWVALPPLAAVASAGAPRPGAQVLVVAGGAAGEPKPLVTTQRFGLGRVLEFTGEASWRWRMLRPSTDTSYETLWRQFVRWSAAAAADPIEIPAISVPLPGTTAEVGVLVRDREYAPIGDAEVTLRVREPGGQERSVAAALADPRHGRYATTVRFDQPGIYMVSGDVRREGARLGTTSRPVLVGGAEVEMSDPRMNASVLRRLAEGSGGQFLTADEAGRVPALLRAGGVGAPPMELRDLWHNGWSLSLIVGLLSLEWLGRRRVGLT